MPSQCNFHRAAISLPGIKYFYRLSPSPAAGRNPLILPSDQRFSDNRLNLGTEYAADGTEAFRGTGVRTAWKKTIADMVNRC